MEKDFSLSFFPFDFFFLTSSEQLNYGEKEKDLRRGRRQGLASQKMNNAPASRVWQAPGAGIHTHSGY